MLKRERVGNGEFGSTKCGDKVRRQREFPHLPNGFLSPPPRRGRTAGRLWLSVGLRAVLRWQPGSGFPVGHDVVHVLGKNGDAVQRVLTGRAAS
jgi:hypothetical protein